MKAQILVNKNFKVGEIDRRIYGSFIEHLGRAVYNGIYEPGHPTADDQGFRQDVIDLIKKLNVPIVRYPGGNFVSGYNWEDGIGDRSKRPQRMELAWGTTETNQIGIDEFQEWAKRADTEVMMAVNLGTRGPEEARNCLEYCNSTTETYWANLRRKNGFEQPFGIKVWCLGNEMDGDWQMGGKTPDEYGRIAFETAKLMKWTDPSIELVACGSSNNKMPTFVDWEYKVLDHTYEYIDYLSLHQYFGNAADDSQDFLCCSVDMDNFIKTIAAVCDAVKAKKRSDKTVNLSFDEWNVWFHSNGAKFEPWSIAPPQLEDIYNFEDALVVGCILTTLQNNCDHVKMACLAQLVNVIAPIMTENGGKAWAQTIFWPFMYASCYGNGTTLKSLVTCDKFSTEKHKDVPYIESSVVYNEKENELVVYAVNRSLTDDVEINVVAEGFEGFKLVEHVELYNDDLKAVNEKDNERVAPANVPVTEGDTVTVKKHSWNMFRYKA